MNYSRVDIAFDRDDNRNSNGNKNIISATKVYLAFLGQYALQNVSFDVAQGEVVTIVGPSGAGKSSFLRCLNLLNRPTSGKIVIDGTPIFDDQIIVDKHELRSIRKSLGMVFQGLNLFPHLTALENVLLAMPEHSATERENNIAVAIGLLTRVGLAHRILASALSLSGGEQQRVAIARALALKPMGLLFDEPTSALDPESSEDVLQVMREMASEGITMVVVTHEMKFALNASDRIVFMENGKIVESGDSKKMFYDAESARAREFFSKAL